MTFLIVLGVIIVLVGLALWLKLRRKKQAMIILQRHSQHLTDAALTNAFDRLGWHYKQPLDPQPMTDVWGHGIMAFTYAVPDPQPKTSRKQLEKALTAAAQDLDIVGSDPDMPAFVVTDDYRISGQRHIDVAFITNQATIEYVRDVARV